MSTKGVAIVTGARAGIGRAIATQLADDGLDVAVNDLDSMRAELAAVAADVQAKGRRALVVVADVSSEAAVKAMVDEVVLKLGSLDVVSRRLLDGGAADARADVHEMVANAGVLGMTSIVDTTAEEFDRVLAINARGPMLCYKYAAIQMIAQGRGGRIIGATSVAGKKACPSAIPYISSKFAVIGMTQGAALELAKHKITVNAYAPGVIDTDMWSQAGKVSGIGEDQFKQMTLGHIPMGHAGQPQDVANVVSFLASEKASYITGQIRGWWDTPVVNGLAY
ncbi:hypothetical protein EWM64_g7664 [Hericium alpestre]|uniref:Uncharacterized protein n=1 Tax=Hericium alpestre TaxID=135208 RepID=A0A4Y9ZS77_9AGAM|nr:hypothetical protein EWM64_g7664 [Hericium alpestre]